MGVIQVNQDYRLFKSCFKQKGVGTVTKGGLRRSQLAALGKVFHRWGTTTEKVEAYQKVEVPMGKQAAARKMAASCHLPQRESPP